MLDIPPETTLDAWVTSDHHWEHPRIRAYQNRPFDHFEIMRERWFETVGPNDIVLHLGDIVCFGDRTRHPFWLDGLPGRKYLLRGNHDKHSDQWYEAAGFAVLGRGRAPILWLAPDEYETLVAFSHEPLTLHHPHLDMPWDVNVHGHTHGNDLWYPAPGRRYRNVCVEMTDYRPIRLRDAIYQ